MNTYVIDWGEKTNGGRYALIQAECIEDAWLIADMIGSPFNITEFIIKPVSYDGEGIRYMEFNPVEDCYAGRSVEKSIGDWKSSGEMFLDIYGDE